jgi:hypothetical protein
MANITVKYIDTTPYVAHVHYDMGSESPCDWGNFDVKIFGCSDVNNAERSEFFDDNDNLNFNMVSKIRYGTAFPVTVRHYSGTDGGYYSVADNVADADGFILFDRTYVKGESFDRRREYAKGDLETYEQWANGEVYWVQIETKDGREIDTLSGLYGTDGIKSYIEETVPDAESVETIGHYDNYSGGGTYEITL